MTEVHAPESVWQGGGEPIIAAWLYRDGELVNRGAVLAVLAVEKAQVELEAPAAGRLQILVRAEVPLAIGQALALIESTA